MENYNKNKFSPHTGRPEKLSIVTKECFKGKEPLLVEGDYPLLTRKDNSYAKGYEKFPLGYYYVW